MRISRLAVVLTLLLAPESAHAQQTRPAQADTPQSAAACPVPADDRWTPQEKFVWEKICAGESADFNEAPGYGGRLDPNKPDDWPESRVLRPSFIATILLNERYSRALPPRGVAIFGARFVETIDLDSATLQNRFLLVESLVEKGLRFTQVRSRYPIVVGGSNVAGVATMNGLDIDANLVLEDSRFASLDLTLVRVGAQLNLVRSTVVGDLSMNGLRARSLTMVGGTFAGIDLTTADLGHFDLYGATVTGELGMNTARADAIQMDKGQFAALDLSGLRIGDELSMQDARVATLQLNGAHVGSVLLLSRAQIGGDVDCAGLEVGRDLWMVEATVGGSVACPDARMGGTVYLSSGHVTQDVDFSDSEIGGLVLNGLRGAALNLENATIGRIPDLTNGWPPKLGLDGLTYRSVGAAEEFDPWLRRMDHYAPQPYEQLATVVQRQGKGTLATAIRYSGRERERTAAKGGAWLWLTALKWVIGYGYHPERSALWALGLVLLGAIVLRVTGEGPRNAMPYGLAYSFDILLPIIRLRDKHYSVDLQTWARYYFYLHRIMGFLLASFLIAGVSGLTK